MQKKFFFICMVSAGLAWTFLFLERGDFSRAGIAAYLISGLAVIIAFGIFVIKNKEIINELTEQPSSKNLEVIKKLFSRQKH